MDSKPPRDEYTGEFKQQIAEATKAVAEQVAFWRDFWKEWIPGGPRKRKRYRTKSHGARRSTRRRKNKVARKARRLNRRATKRPKGRRKP